jgi:hypothetical protein
MTPATGSAATRQMQDYLAAVEHELADLPAEDRSALLEDLALHLEALAAEGDDRPVAVRLGPPAAYAADLPGRRRPATAARRRAARAGRSPRAAGRRPAGGRARRPAGAPAADGVASGLVGAARLPARAGAVPGGQRRGERLPVARAAGSHVLGLVFVVAAVTVSVALGRRSLPRPAGVIVGALGVALVFFSLVVWESAGVARGSATGATSGAVPGQEFDRYPLISRYGPVTDVLPYAADGTPLEGVLLYDQDGRPLNVGFQEWWADGCARVVEQPLAADGVAVPNSFPQAYELDRELESDAHTVDGRTVPMSSCDTDLPRPEVPLPTFPAEGEPDGTQGP